MILDIKDIPFSRFGSYFCMSQDKEDNIYLRDLHGGDEATSRIFNVELLSNGEEVDAEILAQETSLRLFNKDLEDSYVEFCMPERNKVHIMVKDISLKLKANKVRYDSIMQISDNQYEYHVYQKEIKLTFKVLKGKLIVDAPWQTVGNEYIDIEIANDGKEEAHVVIEAYKTVYKDGQELSYQEAKDKVVDEYDQWLTSMNNISEKYKGSVDLAKYITWSSVVGKEGLLTSDAMYMSKNWMFNIWSWDNCFNALMLSEEYPELAYGQYKIFIDNQDESGTYADFINEKYKSFNCVKPPIFPYIYAKMMEKNDYFKDPERLSTVYDSFKKMIGYWLNHRTYEGALPHYRHGNDSGWDNSSLFHEGMPVEAPDLATHLIRSMDTMSDLATKLGLPQDAIEYKAKADAMYELLLERLLDHDGFYGRVGYKAEKISNRESLILMLPIVIGYRLDKDLLDRMVKKLKEDFETPYGLSTESYKSNLYKDTGYWLGPIWAPVSFLIIDALNDYGYEEASKRLAEKFLDLTLVGGMAENFNPFTGEGLVDPSFTWTSSVFLLLGKQHKGVK